MKKFVKVAFVAIFAAIAGYGVYTSQKADVMSELALANVEALAGGESSGNRVCFTKWRKAPNNGSLAFWDWICSECESYWLLEGSIRGHC